MLEYQQCVHRLMALLGDISREDGAQRLAAGQATLEQSIQTWDRLLCDPACTLKVASSMRPVLVQLVSCLVDLHTPGSSHPTAHTPCGDEASFCVALLSVLELAPHVKRLVVQYFKSQPSPMQHLLQATPANTSLQGPQDQTQALAHASWLAVQLAPELGRQWGTAPYVQLLSHSAPVVRWAAAQSLSKLLDMSCVTKTRLLDQVLTPEQLVEVTVGWQDARAAAQVEVASTWLPPASYRDVTGSDDLGTVVTDQPPAAAMHVEAPAQASRSRKRRAESSNAAAVAAAEPVQPVQPALPAARSFVTVCGVELPVREGAASAARSSRGGGSSGGAGGSSGNRGEASLLGKGEVRQHAYVETTTVTQNMQAAAWALCCGRPLLLEGPPGSGKTALIEELARRTGNAAGMVRVHLDDQMDAKSLLGAYMCAAVPGEFTWQPGPLTQAVTEGRWLLVEDINMAPPDVLAALVPLLESGSLTVASRGERLQAAEGFQLLATVTSAPAAALGGTGMGGAGAYATSNMAKELLGGLWAYVRVTPPSEVEQLTMLAAAYPSAVPLLPVGVATLHLVQLAGGHQEAPSTGQPSCWWWDKAAAAALQAAGVRPGELSLALPRHFSVRDLFKWADRLASLHSSCLAARTLRPVAAAVEALLGQTGAKAVPQSTRGPKQAKTSAAPLEGYKVASLDTQVREAGFIESADLFTALVARPEARRRLLLAMATLWALPAEAAADQYDLLHAPHFHDGGSELVVGRAVLDKVKAVTSNTGTFARTGHAMRMMERVAVALARNEPVLLVGETGTGKTTLVSRLAALTGTPLISFNMSAQTDSSDLLGGFKPVEARDALLPLLDPFTELMRKTWRKGNNEEFLTRCAKYAERRKWSHLLQAFKTALSKVLALDAPPTLDTPAATVGQDAQAAAAAAAPKKRKKQSSKSGSTPAAAEQSGGGQAEAAAEQQGDGVKTGVSSELRSAWRAFAAELAQAERAAAVAEGGFAFAFVEGKLVTALRQGWWLLLDEINLAPPEVLERIAGLLEGPSGSVTLVERGDTHTVPRHPSFRLVAAMNPATDAGKRELPAALRNRLTEVWVPEPSAREDLRTLVAGYLTGLTAATGTTAAPPVAPVASSISGGVAALLQPVEACVDLYIAIKAEAEAKLTDGAGQKPAYNLRTLCRALDYARTTAPTYGLQRALYDGFAMAFVTQLSPESEPRVEGLLLKHLLPGMKSAKPLLRTPPEPPGANHVLFEHFWLGMGPLGPPALGRDDDGGARKFVLTASVKRQLCNLARAVLVRKHPILLQGPTSAGKTSLVAYLAAQSGHTLVRINNHEHTDLQEYLGSYVSDASGRLTFREGALVRAVRQGHWLVLDELNLAPSDVLEALNRLLDDNRELFVPELNEVVKPHPSFMLFATQNPPGAYAGRKALSRAFRSRFLELHVEELPDTELAHILEQRCEIAPSYAAKLVGSMRELQRRRQATNVFAGKHGFITPRDLFRWAERRAVGYQALAEDGALLLGERLRLAEDRRMVAEVIAKIMNVKLDVEEVFAREGDAPYRQLAALLQQQQQQQNPSQQGSDGTEDYEALKSALTGIAWTRSMRRMYTLVERCLRHEEPVLLVGETGTGKTTVCQLLALMRGQKLHILNCNQHTETSDFLGGFRPTRGRDRAVGSYVAALTQAQASPLWAAANITPPSLSSEHPSPSDITTTNSQLQAALNQLVGWVQSQPDGCGPPSTQPPTTWVSELTQLRPVAAAAQEACTAACAPFMWVDGPLVTAMRRGDMILIDEINLAEDAVLERLNSVLEPSRTLTLAERGGEGAEVIKAAPGFRILATMNPGGDYGKKELSPALTNRFTSVWVPALEDEEELMGILAGRIQDPGMRQDIAPRLLGFWRFFRDTIAGPARTTLSIRDLLAWIHFINTAAPTMGVLPAYLHGAHLVLLDGLGLGVGLPPAVAAPLRAQCCAYLRRQLPEEDPAAVLHAAAAEGDVTAAATLGAATMQQQQQGGWGIHPFYVNAPTSHQLAANSSAQPKQQEPEERATPGVSFELSAPTAALNAYRVLRALTLHKAALLEGSPGVGKTALVAALARRAGVPLVRINLSEQTDMMDLLGADLPAPGGQPGQFTWCDGPLLAALQQGAWVLLDELNLAGQSVLEGLNALLDHRAEVFIPELGRVFRCHPSFRLFAAQNPLQEGGGRKGLPRSFLNRFTRVYMQLLQREDLLMIASALHPRLPRALLERMVGLLEAMQAAASSTPAADSTPGAAPAAGAAAPLKKDSDRDSDRRFATQGGPWEFNLRDLLRWSDLVERAVAPVASHQLPAGSHQLLAGQAEVQSSEATAASALEAQALDQAAQHYARTLFEHRLRTLTDRVQFSALWRGVWGGELPPVHAPPIVLASETLCVGRVMLTRRDGTLGHTATPGPCASDSAAMQVDEEEVDDDSQQIQLEHEGDVAVAAGSSPKALHLLSWQAPLLESLVMALSRGWMALLVGGPGSGKTSLARLAARLAGQRLTELALTAGTDTSDLLGSFEQVEPSRRVQEAAAATHQLVNWLTHRLLSSAAPASTHQGAAGQDPALASCRALLESWHSYCVVDTQEQSSGAAGTPESHTKCVQALQAALACCQQAAQHLPTQQQPGFQRRLSHLSHDLTALAALLADEASRAVAGRFEWVDGALSRAIAHGGWVLLDNANLCNPTVLDRLNPLLEPGGSLFLAEAGAVNGQPRIIKPHPNFRLILALDPRHGEVSRAMRNRGIELFLLPPTAQAHTAPAPSAGDPDGQPQPSDLWQAARLVAAGEGVAAGGPLLLASVADVHVAVVAMAERAHRRPPSLGDLAAWLQLAQAMVARGWALGQALTSSWELAYLGSLVLGPAERLAATEHLHHMLKTLGVASTSAVGNGTTALISNGTHASDATTSTTSGSEDMDGVEDMAATPNRAPDSTLDTQVVEAGRLIQLDLTNVQPSITGAAAQHLPMLVPCVWPHAISAETLADHVLLSVLRDWTPVAFATALALNSQLPTITRQPPEQLIKLLSPQHQRGFSCWLPPKALAQLLCLPGSSRGRGTGALQLQAASEQQGSNDSVSQPDLATVHAAHRAIWAAVPVLCARSLPGLDTELRGLCLHALSQQAQAVAQCLPGSGAAAANQLLSLSAQVFTSLLSHPLTQQLRQAVTAHLAAGGAPRTVTDLQPLSPEYTHAAHTFTAAATAKAGQSQPVSALWQQWQALAVALPQAALQHHAAQTADAAVGAGSPTAYQLSAWRFLRPEHRAMQDAPHPLIDSLSPTFSHITAVEEVLLNHSLSSDASATWTPAVAHALRELQVCRGALWEACHSPLPTALAAQAQQQPQLVASVEAVTWQWRQLSKAVGHLQCAVNSSSQQVQPAGTTLVTALDALVHTVRVGSEALGLDLVQSKPLLWKLGGHPVLPRSLRLLHAQLHATAIATASHLPTAAAHLQASQAGRVLEAGRLLDGRGYPAGLVTAKVDPEVLVDAAIKRRNPYWDGLGEDAGAVRQRVSLAVAATLLTDPGVRDTLQSGLALLSFTPVSAELALLAAAAPTGATAAQRGMSDMEQRALEVPELLRARVEERATAVADEAMAVEGHAEADLSLKLGARLLLSAPSPEQLLLPAGLMLAPSCRTLQSKLLVLQDLKSIRGELQVLSEAHTLLMQLSLTHPAGLPTSSAGLPGGSTLWSTLPRLSHMVRLHMLHGLRGSTRGPAAFVSHQHLCWLLDSLSALEQPPAAAVTSKQRRAQQQLELEARERKWQYLVQTVLPAVLGEMWLRWHEAVWGSAASTGPLLIGGPGAPASPLAHAASAVQAPAQTLHAAAQSAAAMAAVVDCSGAVQDRAARLLQLRLAAAHLLAAAGDGSAASWVTQARHSWISMTAVLAQIIWSHRSTLSDPAAQQQLASHLSALLQLAAEPAIPAAPSNSLVDSILSLLNATSHAQLAALLQPLLKPALQALTAGLAALPEVAAVGHSPADQQLLQGRCWALLGLLRLHLVAPPRGIDPAGKYQHKAQHMQHIIATVIQPEATVRTALAALPGGPDEHAHLAHLTTQHQQTLTRLESTRSRCVPRPTPPQYISAAQDVYEFVNSVSSVSRVTQLLAQCSSARGSAAQRAAEEAAAWVGTAGAWSERLGRQFPEYLDVLQPVQLAVQEVRQGLGLAGSVAAQRAVHGLTVSSSATAAAGAVQLLGALLQFPGTAGGSSQVAAGSAAQLADPAAGQVAAAVACASTRARMTHVAEASKRDRAAEMAAYTADLQVHHVALRTAAQQLLAAGPAALAAGGSETGLQQLQRLEGLLSGLLDQWAALKAYEERVAEEENEMFKSKTRSTHIATEEEESEAAFRKANPDWLAPFANLPGMDEGPDLMRPDDDTVMTPTDTATGAGGESADEASEAQAASAAARQLLDGALLADVVRLHGEVFGLLAAAGGVAGGGGSVCQRDRFMGAYEVAVPVLAALHGSSATQVSLSDPALGSIGSRTALPASQVDLTVDRRLDDVSLTAQLYRVCVEAERLSGTAAPTAAAATGRARRGAGSASAAEGPEIDILAPCVSELVLLQEPVGGAARRVAELLAEFPEHPVLQQLAAITARLLGLPLHTPLKTALTGLELFLARAQVWEETAAKYVSIKSELTAVAGLATRWRKLELSSWRGTLTTVVKTHESGANRSWFHLYQLLLVQSQQQTQLPEPAAAATASGAAQADMEQLWFQTTVSTLEAFMQTSTLGEFRPRLQLLSSFQTHVQVRLRLPLEQLVAGQRPDGPWLPAERQHARLQLVAAALGNVHAYYSQFSPAVDTAIKEGMAPHEKDLADFVALAKWEDRGYYAMKASTEKAQRHLHKLRQRAEGVLKQPAAAVLAQATQSMGVAEYTAAVKLLQHTEDTPVPPPATATAASGTQPAATAPKPASKVRSRRSKVARKASKVPVVLLTSQPVGLDVGELEVAASLDPALDPPTWSSWQAVTAAAPATAAQLAAAAGLDGQGGAGGPLHTRVAQLARRMATLVSRAVSVDPTAAPVTDYEGAADGADAGEDGAQPAPGDAAAGLELEPGAVQLDDLAGTAAARAAQLRDDRDKGCRLRKKKALGDLLKALGDVGLSRRQADVPKDERSVVNWFKQQQPQLAALLAPAGAAAGSSGSQVVSVLPGAVVEEAQEAWAKAQAYYQRSVARMQKAWAVKETGVHKDVSLAEANSATRLCEHLLLQCRRQRSALHQTNSLLEQLQVLLGWLSQLDSSQQQLVPQPAALHWLQQQKGWLDSLETIAAETVELVGTCHRAGACSGAQQTHLDAAATACKGWHNSLLSAKVGLAKHMATLSLPGQSGGSSVTWVSAEVVAALAVNHAAMQQVAQQASSFCRHHQQAAEAALAAGDPVVPLAPGLANLAAVLTRAVAELEPAAQAATPCQQVAAAPADQSADGQLQQAAEQFQSRLEAAVSAVLVWSQGVVNSAEAATAQLKAAAAPSTAIDPAGEQQVPAKGVPVWSSSVEAAMQLPRLHEAVTAVCTALETLKSSADTAHHQAAASSPAASRWQQLAGQQAAQAATLAPLLRLASGAVELQALRLLTLHRASTKLAYICTSLFATVFADGFCAPQEAGAEAEGGGEGLGEFKEVEGTGMGEGDTRGAKDVSDKLTDEDQLLGAQQKDKPKEENKEDNAMDEKDDHKGIEMEEDFEGEMEDLDLDEKQRDEGSEEDEAGDEDRIDQQMGDAGDNDTRVDEKLWEDSEDEQGGEEEGAERERKEEYDDSGTIQVEDKKDLDYEAGKGGEDDKEDDKGKERDKKQQEAAKKPPPQKEKEAAEGRQDEQQEEGPGEEEEEGPINEDGQDNVQDRPEDHIKPEAPEQELELPDQLNLDGEGEEPNQQEGGEQAEEGRDQEEQAGGEQDAMDTEQQGGEAEAEERQQQGEEQDQEQGEEGGEELPGGRDQEEQEEPAPEEPEDVDGQGQGGIGEVAEEKPEDGEEKDPDQDMEPTAAHGLNEEQQQPPDLQQAGPRGVASKAPTAQGDKGRTQKPAVPQGPPEPQQPTPKQAPQAQPQDDTMDEPDSASAPQPSQPQQQKAPAGGVADQADEGGQIAPLDPGAGGQAPQPQRQERKGPPKRPEPNPLRDLGDAMERWKANLAVQHDVAEQEGGGGDDDVADMHDDTMGGDEDPGASAAEHQFLGQHDKHRKGDTQALAPALEDQAEGLDEEARQHQQHPDEDEAMEDAGEADTGGQEVHDDAAEDGAAPPPVAGSAPRQWQGGQREARLGAEEVQREGERGEEEEMEGSEQEKESEAERLAREMEALFGQRAEGAGGMEESSVVANRMDVDGAQGEEEEEEEDGAEEQGEEGQKTVLGLSAEEVARLRAELDARLSGPDSAAAQEALSEADARYGSEVWARCDALTAGLAGELAEQLRLILEPTLASRLAGEYRTGKRISMRKVIAYIASHFRKDKIWLRRSRPDKRRYQVVLAVDDSRSMSECGCGGVALEALTLLCKALSRLEVGQIGVVKFGGPDGVVPLHALTQPFTDSAGPGIMANLRFKQDNTIADQPMLKLVEALDHMLDVARHHSGAGGIGVGTQDLAQLVLVVADGRLHEKDALRARIRELTGKRGVCVVFIAIDSPAVQPPAQPAAADAPADPAATSAAPAAAKPAAGSAASGGGAGGSLLDMQAVTFQGGKPVFKRYMDDFPWPYYVLLRDISALPSTLADLLRQWFELSAANA